MQNQIFWLSSYPKSGNTLLRSILISLFFSEDGKFELEHANKIGQFESTNNIRKNYNLFEKDYNKLNELSTLYKYFDQLQDKKSLGFNQDFIFLKTHSGLFEIGGNAFTNEINTRGIIYIVRDPRDVCISWAKHTGITLDQSINFMLYDLSSILWMEPQKNQTLFTEKKRPRSLLSSWEKHVLSWTSLDWKIPILILKFEDLVYNKESQILNLVDFFQNNYGFKFNNINKKIKNILISTEFGNLKKEEEQKGFLEATNNNSFFSVGKKDQWKSILDKNQVKKIENKFGKLMKKFGYEIDVEF